MNSKTICVLSVNPGALRADAYLWLKEIMRLNDLFNRLETQQNAMNGQIVLAPTISNRAVSVQIAGVACQLQIDAPRGQASGWSVSEVLSSTKAKWLRAATKAEIEKYLALLPRVRFIALERERRVWAAWPAHSGDARFRLNGAALVRGSGENVQAFDTILARFDGTHFWFEAPDSRRSPAISQFLRESLSSTKAPESLQKKGLSSEERAAYAFAFYGPPVEPTIEIASSTKPQEQNVSSTWRGTDAARLARSIEHAGAQMVSYIERAGAYTVTYKFGDRTHTSTVNAGDLSVMTSGICLSGRDGDFDLTSLVGVMQEAARVEPWQFDEYDY